MALPGATSSTRIPRGHELVVRATLGVSLEEHGDGANERTEDDHGGTEGAQGVGTTVAVAEGVGTGVGGTDGDSGSGVGLLSGGGSAGDGGEAKRGGKKTRGDTSVSLPRSDIV